jgi:hypothetical protein
MRCKKRPRKSTIGKRIASVAIATVDRYLAPQVATAQLSKPKKERSTFRQREFQPEVLKLQSSKPKSA